MKLIVVCLALLGGVAFCQGNGVGRVVTATGASVSSGLEADGWYSFSVCEGNTVTFECSSGVLAVESDTCVYGSAVGDSGYAACPHPANGECGNSASCNALVENACEGNPSCSVAISNGNIGLDPCGGIYKYATMRLQCVREVREFPLTRALAVTAVGAADYDSSGLDSDGWYNFRVCEGVSATFGCSTGVLVVNPDQQCVYGSEIEDPGYLACEHSAKGDCDTTASCDNLLEETCQGESECTVSFTNGALGSDPCPGIYKYATVSLKCSSSCRVANAFAAAAAAERGVDILGVESAAAAAERGVERGGANFFTPNAPALSTVSTSSSYIEISAKDLLIIGLLVVNLAVFALLAYNCVSGKAAKFQPVKAYSSEL
mmetsp:Transcript_48669/g.80726  ORF Transcript_48669/g.80726 Transcript_48669/m.80726 type:complete len:375 (+) Transcript_48669:101-1225(+)